MPDLPWLLIFRFGVCTLVGCAAVTTDWRERKIPNWLTVPLCLAGFIARGATEYGGGLLDALAGFSVGFAIFFVLFLLGSGAGGDVKFMAAVGTWLGPYHVFVVVVFSAVLMLVCVLVMLTSRLLYRVVSKANENSPASLLTHTVPYALPATLAIAVRLVHLLLIGRHS